ncbi:MAG: MerR family transcriptional regulator [Alphaproteobacteria bacterium]|nr:MAG: MerR family transcriptional regulator [Alphaproteobacteria bacterium]
MTHATEEPIFTIGAASRLTGIPADTLRAWERRYNAVAPRRCPDNNRRGYTRADLARLGLIKQLVDQGHAVSSVVHLPEEALKERMRIHAGLRADAAGRDPGPERPARVLVFGDGLPFQARNWKEEMPSLDIIGAHTVSADFERAVLAERPEVLLVEAPALQPAVAGRICGLAHRGAARRVVIVYAFAASSLLDKLHRQGVTTLRAPVTAAVLEEACRLAPAAGQALKTGWARIEDEAPPRRFDGEALAAIANTATRLQCECPQHLTDLLFRLGAFEAYSADCETRNPQDAELHLRLQRAAGEARAVLEEALAGLLESEGWS